MGSISKNFDRLGNRLSDRVGDLRSSVSHTLDDLGDRAAKMNRHEGSITSRLENLTSALPSSTWLALAGGALAGSIVLKAFHKNHASMFIGGFAPTFLLLGIYNKLVKVHGSDRFSR
jgi:hypothetical protein